MRIPMIVAVWGVLVAAQSPWPSPQTMAELEVLLEQSEDLTEELDAEDWEAHLRQLRASYLAEHGERSRWVALTNLAIVNALRHQRRLNEPEAWDLLSVAEEVFEAEATRDDEHLARVYLVQGAIIGFRSDHVEARGYIENAIQLFESVLGDSEELATALGYYTWTFVALNQELDRAAELAHRAIAIRESLGQADHENASFHHWHLARIADIQGRNTDAFRHYERTYEIRVMARGQDSVWAAQILVPMGWIDIKLGRFADAEAKYADAYPILETAGPSGLNSLAWLQNNLGILYDSQARFDRALVMYRRAHAVYSRTWPEDHPAILATNLNMANTLAELGESEEADTMFRSTLEAMREKYDGVHDDIAILLRAMGRNLNAMGRHEEALGVLEESLEVSRKVRGHAVDPVTFIQMAATALDHADPNLALTFVDRIAAAPESEVSPYTHSSAAILRSEAYVALGRGDEAEAILKADLRATMELRQNSNSENFPLQTRRLGLVAMVNGDLGRALDLSVTSQRRTTRNLGVLAHGLPEARALTFSARQTKSLNTAVSILRNHTPSLEQLRAVWGLAAAHRGLVLRTLLERRRMVAHQDSPHAEAWADVNAARRDLAHIYMQVAKDPGNETLKAKLTVAQERADETEGTLAAAMGWEKLPSATREVDIDQLARHVPPNAALVAFFRYELWDSTRDWTPLPVATETYRYAAFVLPAGGGSPQFVDLGDAARVDAQVERWVSEASAGERLAGRSPRGARREYHDASQAVMQSLWEPLRDQLEDASEILWIPDGTLYQLNPAALMQEDGAYWVEAGVSFHRLASEHDLLPRPSANATGLLAIGDVTYSDPPEPAEPGAPRAAPCLSQLASSFPPIPGTAEEVASVAASWPTRDGVVLRGDAATEEAFYRQAPGKRVIHLATHAFFLDEECTEEVSALEVNDSPLIRSGLAMAHSSVEANEQGYDGILTAEEIATMNLAGTQRVVLSACHTSAGVLTPGEGSMGLVRSFLVAGAEQVVMSLWPVEDQSTSTFMDTYYAKGTSISDAHRARLAQLRSAGASDHPSHWAGFVSTGHRRDLRP